MKKGILFSCFLFVSSSLSLVAEPRHTPEGTHYGMHDYKGHGPDGAHFLDPYIQQELKEVCGKVVLDAGCGLADWSIVAAKNGAQVHGVDIQKNLLDKAQIAIAQAGVQKAIELHQGDVANLPYDEKKFDVALSINVGCNLPRTMQMVSTDRYTVSGLGAHFREIARVMKEGGRLLVAAPASFGILFTDAKCNEQEVKAHIDQVLAKIGSSEDGERIVACLKELEEVHRATFVRRGERLVLVTDEKELKPGEEIWRKIPGTAVPNYYHCDEEYLVAIANAGLFCEEIKRPCFFGGVKYRNFRAQSDALGEAYKDNNPFTLYYVTKK